ncbi:DNA polymerase beta [Faustovirus]|nr:DNA polymerase beta [Faustovirus]QJX73595.1 DNA polymerase beta [Faustovirus]
MSADHKAKVEAEVEGLPERVSEMVPTVLSKANIGQLPTRNDLLGIPQLLREYQAAGHVIPILFHPITVLERDEWVKNADGYSGKHVFKVNLFGIDQLGRKTVIRIVNVPIYVDIMVPRRFRNQTAEFYTSVMSSLTHGPQRPDVAHWDIVHGYRLHGFQQQTRPWLRFHFANMGLRSAFIDLVAQHNEKYKTNKKQQYCTANDDSGRPESGYYFNKMARERGINTAGWNIISSDQPGAITEIYAPYGPLRNFDKGYECEMNCLTRCKNKIKARLDPITRRLLERPKKLSMFWDIETEGGRDIEDHDNMDVFNISMMFYTLNSDRPILSIGLTKHNSISLDGYTIVCGSEIGVVDTFLAILARYLPDYGNGFNSQRFDWRVMFHKFRRYGKFNYINEMISLYQFGAKCNLEKKFFTREQIKINAEKTHISDYVAKIPGMLDSDTQPLFYKLYPKMEIKLERSLNYFLQLNDLPAKDDMPISRLWRIKRYCDALDGNPTCHCKITAATGPKHCVDDCQLCHDSIKIDPFDMNSMGKFDPRSRIDTALVPRRDPTKCCRCDAAVFAVWMGLIDHYCKIDSHRTQQLIYKRGIYIDKCELANLSFVQLYDAFYRADGMKVRNIIGRYAPKFNIMFSNARKNIEQKMKQHYPGAWVFPPKYGYYKHRPITGEDFSSLYPSIIMCYNFSPDRVVTNPAKAEALIAQGYKLHPVGPITVERGEKKGQAGNTFSTVSGWMVAHGNIYDPKVDTQVVNEFEKEITYKVQVNDSDNNDANNGVQTYKFVQPIRAEWTAPLEDTPDAIKTEVEAARAAGAKVVREVKYLPKPSRAPLVNEKMGIFGYVLKKLFDKRVPIKKEFVKLCEILEIMKKQGVTELVYTDGRTYHRHEVEFDAAKLDAVQKALKVLSNTFYGESGNFRSAIYALIVAAGITAQGQLEIKFVSDGVIVNGFKLYYGDTDSMYISAPEAIFELIDAWFKMKTEEARLVSVDDPVAGEALLRKYREEYYTQMVQLTMTRMKTLCEEISDRLAARTGTRYLNMAYEEVGYPTAWCGKKKYFMTAHIKTINFDPDEYFLRGVEIVKQGVNAITKQLGNEFIKEAMDIHSDREPIDIAKDKLVKFFTNEWSIEMFAQTATYKPAKDNKSVKRFHERMTAIFNTFAIDDPARELYRPPDAGDKFKYVIVKRPEKINQKGNKEKMTKGDFMEYLDVYMASQAHEHPLELDLEWYFERSFITSFARFICYYKDFAHPDIATGEVDPDLDDTHRIEKATEWLIAQANQFSDKAARAEKMKKLQSAYRRVYKEFEISIRDRLYEVLGDAALCIACEGIYKGQRNLYDPLDMTEIVDKGPDAATGYIDKWCSQVGDKLERDEPVIEPIYKKCSELPIMRLTELRRDCMTSITNNDVIYNNMIDEARKTLRNITCVFTELIKHKNNVKGELVTQIQLNCGGHYDKIVFTSNHINAVVSYQPHEAELVAKFHDTVSKLITCYRLKTRNRIKLTLVVNAINFRNNA